MEEREGKEQERKVEVKRRQERKVEEKEKTEVEAQLKRTQVEKVFDEIRM